jgi:hypothetical protein
MPPFKGWRRRHLTLFAFGLPLLASEGVSTAVAADWETCRYFSQLPDDCAGAEQRKFVNLRGARFEEFELFAKDPLKKVLYVSTYNTTGLNGGDDSGDSAPSALAQKLDPKGIAKQYQALFASISPPRYWTLDWLADRVGAVRNFDGLDAAWMGNRMASGLPTPGKPSSSAFRAVSVAITSTEGYKKGSEVYLLDDPGGRTWVMTSYTDKKLSDLTVERLQFLGDLMTAPQGWKFRAAVLSKELILEPKGGFARVLQDDKDNIYYLTGPGQSNFAP